MRFKITFTLLFIMSITVLARAAEIMPLREIRPGMKGTGKTVFKGTEPETFDVEVIDVVKNVMPGRDVILVKCSGHGLEKIRVVAGMSGSPVYLEGKLAGAIAFTWSYSQDPIAGVTPIENMLEEAGNILQALTPASDISASAAGLAPIATPLVVSGADQRLLAELEESLKPYNLVAVPGGSAADDTYSPKLEEGSAIGAQLVSGDINVTAVGTVSYLEGNTVIAFGHSFINAGRISVPITTAKIHTIVGSQYLSFKVASPIKQVGSMEQDRTVGIYGRIGAEAETVPCEIKVSNKALGTSSQYHYEVVSHRVITYPLISLVLAQSISSAGPATEPCTVKVKTDFKLKGYPMINFEDTYFANQQAFSNQFLEPLRLMLMNPFEYSPLEKVSMDLEISTELKLANIRSAWIKNPEISAGDNMEVHVMIKPYDMPETEQVMMVPVPREARGILNLQISGGGAVAPDIAEPQSVEDLIKALDRIYPTKSIVAAYSVDAKTIDHKGRRLHKLPPSVAAAINPESSNAASTAREMFYQVKETPYIVTGKTMLSIQVAPPKSK